MLVPLRREASILAVYSIAIAVASVLIASPDSVWDALAVVAGSLLGLRLIRTPSNQVTDHDAPRSELVEAVPYAAARLAILAAPVAVASVLVAVVSPFVGSLMAGMLVGVTVRYALAIRATSKIEARTGTMLARRAPRRLSPVRDRDPQYVRVRT